MKEKGLPEAFVLFNVESGSEDQVLNDSKGTVGVEKAYVSYGMYDLILKMKADSMKKLKNILTHRHQSTKNVRSTRTLILTQQ